MNRTRIEWVRNPDGTQGYTWNVITGCLNHVNGLCNGGGFPCYAYKLANGRLKQRYIANSNYAPARTADYFDLNPYIPEDPFYPRFWEEKLSQPIGYASTEQVNGILAATPPKGKGIFVCDMSDLFGVGIPEEWTRKVLRVIEHTSYNRYYLLTKQPQNLQKWSPFPENVYLGVTVTNQESFNKAIHYLNIVDARVKFISFEPLLERITLDLRLQKKIEILQVENAQYKGDSKMQNKLQDAGISWLIIGACSGSLPDMTLLGEKHPDLWLAGDGHKITAQPKIEWVKQIVEAADGAGVKVFLKDNLRPLIEGLSATEALPFYDSQTCELRQEMPIRI